MLQCARERHALDALCAPTKQCSVAPEGSVVNDAVEPHEGDGDDEPYEDVHHGVIDDVCDDDGATETTAFELAEPVPSGVSEAAAAVPVAPPADEEERTPVQDEPSNGERSSSKKHFDFIKSRHSGYSSTQSRICSPLRSLPQSVELEYSIL